MFGLFLLHEARASGPWSRMVQLAVPSGMPTLSLPPSPTPPLASELGRMCCGAALCLGTQTQSALPGSSHLLGYPSRALGCPRFVPNLKVVWGGPGSEQAQWAVRCSP